LTHRWVVGFCRSCRAVMWRDEWLGPVKCKHRPGCLEARRQRHRKERLT